MRNLLYTEDRRIKTGGKHIGSAEFALTANCISSKLKWKQWDVLKESDKPDLENGESGIKASL